MFGILVDVTRCTGCERCVEGCASRESASASPSFRSVGRPLSASRLCSIERIDRQRFARMACMHCLEPACAAACLVGALSKTGEGPVVYSAERCIGCRYCMLACPHHVPRYEWNASQPYVKKCDMCSARLKAGARPACVEACPNDALAFGDRATLLARARETIAASPRRYLQRVWGETEWGGTSVLYVSDVDLSQLGFRDASTPPIPSLTDPLIVKTPFVGAGVAFGLWALAGIINRRNKLMAASGTHSGEKAPDTGRAAEEEGQGRERGHE